MPGSERSVSAAARRLHLSQPATSNALERVHDFDPASMESSFSVGVDEYSMALYGRAMVERVAREAR